MDSFWRHSVACAVGAQILATHRREPNVERFFVAGLLHDIGRPILYLQPARAVARGPGANPKDGRAAVRHRARDLRVPPRPGGLGSARPLAPALGPAGSRGLAPPAAPCQPVPGRGRGRACRRPHRERARGRQQRGTARAPAQARGVGSPGPASHRAADRSVAARAPVRRRRHRHPRRDPLTHGASAPAGRPRADDEPMAARLARQRRVARWLPAGDAGQPAPCPTSWPGPSPRSAGCFRSKRSRSSRPTRGSSISPSSNATRRRPTVRFSVKSSTRSAKASSAGPSSASPGAGAGALRQRRPRTARAHDPAAGLSGCSWAC